MLNKETKKTVSAPKQKSFVPYALVSLILIVIIVIGGLIFYKQYSSVEYVNAKIGSETFKLELANTQAAREKGLSERDAIGKNEGMLFDFEENGRWRMWMVQMRFPIDIAWLDESKKIIFIKNNSTPAEFPEKYDAKQDSRYVIEVPEGSFERLNVNTGDSISF